MGGRQNLRSAVRTTALLGATAVLSAQSAQLQVTPETLLRDERFRITLEGVRPGQDVTIRADGNSGQWHSNARYRAKDSGRVEIADPMRFIWSATGITRPMRRYTDSYSLRTGAM